jgi:hypothetical protein
VRRKSLIHFNAAAVAHLLSTAGEIIIAFRHIRLGLYTRSLARHFREQVRLWNSNV